jgi:Ca-activated chloride channel homolog
MLRLSKPIPVIILAALLSIPIAAQFKEAPAEPSTTTFRADTRLVVLHASVTDKSGRLLMNLPQGAFRVFENGVEQYVKRITREDVPVSMGLVIDNSSSMRTKRKKVETSAMALVKSSNPLDEVFIVNFNEQAYLDQPLTSDMRQLERGVARINSHGSTALHDAIHESVDYLVENGKKDKKVLIVVTDGEDNSSTDTLENLIEATQRTEVTIYTVGLLSDDDRHEARRAAAALTAISQATGGQAYYPRQVSDVGKVCQQVAQDIRSQYIIEYSPENKELDGSFRQVKVVAEAPNHPVVRTRSGYYASPVSRASNKR